MENFCNLISFHRNFIFFQNQPSHSKVTVTKVKVSTFSAEQTAHWSTYGLVAAVACLRTVKKVANPHSISKKDTQNRIMRKFRQFNIRNQNVILSKAIALFLVLKLNGYAYNLHLNEKRDKKIVSDIFLHQVYLEGSEKYEMI